MRGILTKNRYSEKTDLYISVDYPPDQKYYNGYEDVKNYVKTITGFKTVNIYIQDHNLGVVGNWRLLKDIVFSRYESYIASEDDNEFSPNFLDYINKGLELFKDDENISAICSSNDELLYQKYESSYFKLKWHNARGVGSWVDTEKKIHKSVTEDLMDMIVFNPANQKKILKYNRILYQAVSLFLTDEMPIMKDISGKPLLMDYTRSLYNILNDSYCICPIISKSKNWGYDGSGINTPADDNYNPENIIIDDTSSFDFIKTDDQEDAEKEAFINQHSRYTVKTLSYIRSRIIMFLHNTLNAKMFENIIPIIKH